MKNVPSNGQVDDKLHAVLRFAVGTTASFVLCEVLRWPPSFLAPVLTAVLLANLPMRPPLKMGLALVLTMAVAALLAFALASLFHDVPMVLFGAIALCMFLAFLALLSGRPRLPALLLLICLATIPVVVTIAPVAAGILPLALIRGIALALLVIWAVYLPWPRVAAATPAPAAATDASSPLAMALFSTAIVLPLMLVYLLFGLADVLPVLVATVMLVANFDVRRSRLHALAMILGNFAGGLLGLLMHTLLLTTPTLPFLTLLLFVVLLGFGRRIAVGGPAAAVALIACNAMLIIFGTAIASGPGSLSLWLARLLQFTLAGAFAIGMMTLVRYRMATVHPPGQAAT
ncbi:MAG TPA: DUF2955 domain-containing protein [Luteibacter sp.]|nr:DUF2955 domain-containing protein [Luteibacter sp.]